MHASGEPGLRHPIGIIDIGSNTIRLVVYDGLRRTPLPLFNEKATCALGAGLEATGHLNPAGIPLAISAVERFVRLARAMNVERLDVLATAACRDAKDGAKFLASVEKRCDIKINLLSGEEEANRSAYGVLCAIPDANGVVCDLGGGSLELVMVSDGKSGASTTVPLGMLRLTEGSGGERSKAGTLIEERLAGVDFLAQGRGRHLYAVGGSWRALAQVCIEQANYPLHVLDNFTLPAPEARSLLELLSTQSPRSLEKLRTISRKRIPYLPLAALLLLKLIEAAKPDVVVFSVYGMREGQFFLSLPEDKRQGDPLIAAVTDVARSAGRFPEHGRELMDWMAPLFPLEAPDSARMRLAICLLSDTFWDEHPDFRAEQAFLRTLRMPIMGLNHTDRASLALAIYHRYDGQGDHATVRQAIAMLDMEAVRRARIIGAALRLGHTISGGAPGLLQRTKLTLDKRKVVLHLPADDAVFMTSAFDRRLDHLAQELGLAPSIVVG